MTLETVLPAVPPSANAPTSVSPVTTADVNVPVGVVLAVVRGVVSAWTRRTLCTCGVTAADAAESAPVPTALIAATVNV